MRWPRAFWKRLEEIETDVPMVVRLAGTNAEEGREILREAEMETASNAFGRSHKSGRRGQGAEE